MAHRHPREYHGSEAHPRSKTNMTLACDRVNAFQVKTGCSVRSSASGFNVVVISGVPPGASFEDIREVRTRIPIMDGAGRTTNTLFLWTSISLDTHKSLQVIRKPLLSLPLPASVDQNV